MPLNCLSVKPFVVLQCQNLIINNYFKKKSCGGERQNHFQFRKLGNPALINKGGLHIIFLSLDRLKGEQCFTSPSYGLYQDNGISKGKRGIAAKSLSDFANLATPPLKPSLGCRFQYSRVWGRNLVCTPGSANSMQFVKSIVKE